MFPLTGGGGGNGTYLIIYLWYLYIKEEKISDKAETAERTVDFWSLFFPDTILDKIVLYTNQKIHEDMEGKQYTEVQLRKSPHMKPVDKVTSSLYRNYSNRYPKNYVIISSLL
jgi:hypothetical protein